MNEELLEVLEVLSHLGTIIGNEKRKFDFYFIGGVARYLAFGGDFPEDIDIYVKGKLIEYKPGTMWDTHLSVNFQKGLKLLERVGYLERRKETIDLDNRIISETFTRYYVNLRSGKRLKLDIMFDLKDAEILANFVRVKIDSEKNYSLSVKCGSISSVRNNMIECAFHDAREKRITINPSLKLNSVSTRIWLYRRVIKYLLNGWTLNREDEVTMDVLPKWLIEDVRFTGDDLCPITHEKLSQCDRVIQVPCKHCFDAWSLIIYLTTSYASTNKVSCPICRQKIPIIDDEDISGDDEEDSFY
jgi:hypothetical protein